MGWHLAEINVARLRAPLDDPRTRAFVDGLDDINRLADSSPGFVWRLQTEDGNATAVRAVDDELVIVNMSTWESVRALGDYVYRSGHVAFLRRKREWFERYGSAQVALWWVPDGTVPSLEDALDRLAHLDAHGPTPRAFTFGRPFPPPDSPDSGEPHEDTEVDLDNVCPA